MNQRVAVGVLGFLLCVVAFLGWRILALRARDLGPAEVAVLTSEPETHATATAFVAAWRRDLDSTYLANATVGLAGDGIRSETTEVRVHRNGQSLVNRDSTIFYQRDGQTETCRQTNTELFCTPPSPAPTPGEDEAELTTLLVEPGRQYRTTEGQESGCFVLEVDLSLAVRPLRFGNSAEICFDPSSGALRSSVIQRDNREDFAFVGDISDVVLESDLRGRFPEPIIQSFFETP